MVWGGGIAYVETTEVIIRKRNTPILNIANVNFNTNIIST